MSAEQLRNRAAQRIVELRDRATEFSLNARFRPSAHGSVYMPATTAEEIALQVLEGNALVRGYTAAIEAINEEYTKMMQPDEDRKPEQERGSAY
jgi:hypothetical protein